MNWLLLLFYIELGAVTTNNWVMQEADYYLQDSPQYYTEVGARAEMFDIVFLESKIKTRAYHHKDSYMFSPFTDEYTVSTGLSFENIEIGFRHLCTHPVIPYIDSVDRAVVQYEGGYEEFYIRFETWRNK